MDNLDENIALQLAKIKGIKTLSKYLSKNFPKNHTEISKNYTYYSANNVYRIDYKAYIDNKVLSAFSWSENHNNLKDLIVEVVNKVETCRLNNEEFLKLISYHNELLI